MLKYYFPQFPSFSSDEVFFYLAASGNDLERVLFSVATEKQLHNKDQNVYRHLLVLSLGILMKIIFIV